jgi:hypothetical protein
MNVPKAYYIVIIAVPERNMPLAGAWAHSRRGSLAWATLPRIASLSIHMCGGVSCAEMGNFVLELWHSDAATIRACYISQPVAKKVKWVMKPAMASAQNQGNWASACCSVGGNVQTHQYCQEHLL